MTSTVSKQKIQKLMDEIEKLKQKNRDQAEANENEIQDLKRRNSDLRSINTNHATEIQHLKQVKVQELVSKNEEVLDELRDLRKKNRELISDKSDLTDKIEEYLNKIQRLEQQLCTKFDDSKTYNRLTLSPVSVNKLQHCTEWWCPKHSQFATNVEKYIPNNEEDKLKVQRAKYRFAYWNKKDNEDTCCKNNRQNKDRNKFSPPSNWPK